MSRARGIHRDRWGVPHVVADDVLDLARLQGVATATDRAWQLEHGRRRASGRTAELVGGGGVDWDVLARRADLDGLARRCWARTGPETQAFLTAYVEGVNAVLPAATCPELDHLGADAEEWEPWTPLAVFAAAHLLFSTFPMKLWRRHARRVLGERAAALFHHEGLQVAGSNSWVVGGDRTRSGRPLLAGDPHRTFEEPNVYAQVRLTCLDEDFDVAGFAFPGVPGVQHFGHAGTVAWGITNAMADYQDLYVEELRQRGAGAHCRDGDGWTEVESRTETVLVRDGDPVEVTVVRTPRGPVVAEDTEGRCFSLRSPSDVLADLGFDCLLPLLRSRTADDVVSAFGGWVEPVNNLVTADADGRIRQQVVGRVPTRHEDNCWVPVPAVPGHQWSGWAELPGREVGPGEHLVTANQRMPGFDAVGVDFAPPARADRIEALLADRDDLTVHDCLEIHGDVLAGQPAHLHAALSGLEGLDGVAEKLRLEIVRWDQRFDVDSVGAASYVAVRDELVRLVTGEPALDGLEEPPYRGVLARWIDLRVQVYLGLGNLLSPEGLQLLPHRDDLLRAAVTTVAEGATPHAVAATWGERHRFRPPHALDALGFRTEEPGARLAGDNDCVRCAGQVPGTDVVVRGSVARYAWDLSGLAASGWVVPGGADGRPHHPHHEDQRPWWITARLLPVDGGDATVDGMELVTPGADQPLTGGS